MRGTRGRRPTRRDPDDTHGDDAFADLVDELPGSDTDIDLQAEIRRMEISSGSAAYSIRRRG